MYKKQELENGGREGGGGAKSLNFRGARSLKGGEIPWDLASGRAKSLGISPRGGRNPWGGEIPATPVPRAC